MRPVRGVVGAYLALFLSIALAIYALDRTIVHGNRDTARLTVAERSQLAASVTECERVNELRDSVNRTNAILHDILQNAAVTGRGVAHVQSGKDRDLTLLFTVLDERAASEIRKLPRTDCAQAVAHPRTYRAPPETAFPQAHFPKVHH